MPRLLYIGQTPAEGTGSPVIILRHLQRLAAAGWKISIIAESGQDATACHRANWTVLTLPLRRAWWPPFRRHRAGSRAVRTWLLAGECHRLTSAAPPDAVLGYLAAHDDFFAEVAARFARRYRLPLSLLVHDHAAAFPAASAEKLLQDERHAWMVRAAHRCWFASPELAAAFGMPAEAAWILPPIPDGGPQFGQWCSSFALWPRVYYAGSIWPAQFPLLRKIAQILAEAGACLVVISRETPALAEFLRSCPNCQHMAPFPTNREALAHLARDAAGVLVSYADTVGQMPWIATSFPSKFIEYSHLGLPCAIVAPPDSAVGRWAQRDGYADFFAPADLSRLDSWARDLRSEVAWGRHSQPARQLAEGEFNAERIQTAFAAGLLRN